MQTKLICGTLSIVPYDGWEAISIVPRRALIDWINEIDTETPCPYSELFEDEHALIYLIPACLTEEIAYKWLDQNYKSIFWDVLYYWCIDESLFPPLTLEKFSEFCRVTYHMNVNKVEEITS